MRQGRELDVGSFVSWKMEFLLVVEYFSPLTLLGEDACIKMDYKS